MNREQLDLILSMVLERRPDLTTDRCGAELFADYVVDEAKKFNKLSGTQVGQLHRFAEAMY